MSKRQRIARIYRDYLAILASFDRAATGDPYGWDWPTMNVLFPQRVARARMLKREYHILTGGK